MEWYQVLSLIGLSWASLGTLQALLLYYIPGYRNAQENIHTWFYQSWLEDAAYAIALDPPNSWYKKVSDESEKNEISSEALNHLALSAFLAPLQMPVQLAVFLAAGLLLSIFYGCSGLYICIRDYFFKYLILAPGMAAKTAAKPFRFAGRLMSAIQETKQEKIQ